MTISKDLFLAILSLDSYNRGYHAGISDEGPRWKGFLTPFGTLPQKHAAITIVQLFL